MSIRGYKVLWLSLKLDGNKRIHFTLPIPLFIFRELLDCLMDLLVLVSLFVPGRHKYISSGYTAGSVRELAAALDKLLDALSEGEPYELVGVSCKNVNVSVKIR